MATTELPDFVIAVDSREKCKPSLNAPTRVVCLRTGDLSIIGYEDQIALERKRMNDLAMCLSKERERFKRELERARSFDYFAVVIEGTFADLASGRYTSRLHPNSAVESISAFEVRYKIPFLFCGTQALAARKC